MSRGLGQRVGGVAAIASVALVAAGCGGSGGTTITIHSMNMRPTLVEGDHVHFTHTGSPRRGDIILFTGTPAWLDQGTFPKGARFVDRVIGVGGDHVVCCDANDRLTINGVALSEQYLGPGQKASVTPFDVTVPPGRLWVMGDNRDGSADSRAHLADAMTATIPSTDVLGVADRITAPKARARQL